MICSVEALKCKEVIDSETGERLGFIDDAEINIETSEISALIIYGRNRFFGLLGKENDIIIPCCNIRVVGTDVLLISQKEKRTSMLTNNRRDTIKNLFR